MTKHFTNLFRYIPPRDHIEIFPPLYNYKSWSSCPITIVRVMFIALPTTWSEQLPCTCVKAFNEV